MANATSTQLQELYVAYFGRAADPTGLDYWTEKGITQAGFAANMYAQPEFESAYGSSTTEVQVNQIYKNLFDREADVAGLTYWTQEINLGNLQLAEIATHLIWAAQNNDGSADDKTALTNRTNAAVAYTAKVKETTAAILAYAPTNDGKAADSTYEAGAAITEAISYLSGIDKDTAHTAAGVAASVTTVTTAAPAATVEAKSFTLTTGVDSFTGEGGADTFSGSNTTLTAGDTLVGGTGTDTLTIAAAATATFGGFTVSGIETTSFSASGGASTVDMLNVTDATTVAGIGSSQNITFSNINDLPTVKLANNSAGNVTFGNLAGDVTGTADSQTLELVSTTNGTVTIASVETLDVSNSGTSTITTLTTTAAKTLNLTGSGDLTLTNIDDAVETIDGSAYTGKVLWGGIGSNDMTITGGTGADTFDFTGGNPTSSDVVDGGDGTDTLRVDVTLTSSTAVSKVTNVENIHLIYTADATDASIDATLFDGIEVQVADTSATDNDGTVVTITNAKSTQAVKLDNSSTAGENDGLDGLSLTLTQGVGVGTSTDIFNLTMENERVTTLTSAGYETVNISSNVGANIIDSFVATSAQNIVIDGAKNLTLTAVDMEEQSSTKVSKVDASALSGKLVMTMSNNENDQTILGGSNDDSITMAFSALDSDDTITGNDGTDTLTLTDFTGDIGEVEVDVERLKISGDATSQAAATVIDLRNSTTLNRVTVDLDDTVADATGAADMNITVNNMAQGTEVIVEDNFAASSDVLTLDGASGATSLTVKFDDTITSNSGAGAATDFVGQLTANYDTLTLTTNDSNTDVTIAVLSGATIDTLNVTGSGDMTITSATTTTSIDTVEASSFSGALTFTSLARANGATINLGGGADSINFVTTSHSGNTITGGSGSDTLVFSGASTANIVVDLTSTTDQVTNLAGAANSAAQTGFENITATAVTSSGINVTGSTVANTVYGTNQADTITSGTGAMTLYPDGGNDVITGGSGVDTIVFASTAALSGTNTITGFTLGASADILYPNSFLAASAMNAKIASMPTAAVSVENDVNLLVDVNGGQDITTVLGLTTAVAGTGEYKNVDMTASKSAIFVTAASANSSVTQHVFFATSDGSAVITPVKVATIGSVDIDSFVAANFGI